jgi:predicted TPR repeat methyltransferase
MTMDRLSPTHILEPNSVIRGTASFEDLLYAAIVLHQRNEIEPAEVLYTELLTRDPRNADVLHFLGVLRNGQGRCTEAVDLIRTALELAPGYVDAWNNLGNVYRHLNRLDEAGEAYQKALDLDGAHIGAWNNLATVLRERGAVTEALDAHRRVIELAPDLPDVYYNYANTLRACGNLEVAIAAYRRTIELNPAHSQANNRIGYLLHRVGRTAEAEAVYRDWSTVDPTNPIARHMLAACTGVGVPERASDDYLRRTFDDFADSFDLRLLEHLHYRAPQIVADAIAKVVAPQADLDVLDAGCGTGLCAAHLRPFARRLVGVDLSEGMLQKAVARGGYDRLEAGEITRFLSEKPAAFDLIASADTLVYFGALEQVVAAARLALRPGGWLAFTVERQEENAGIGYRMAPHGRYVHSESYLRSVLTRSGFADLAIQRVVPRTEGGADVDGLVVTARVAHRPADAGQAG